MPGLLAWQREGYARYHQSRANLLMHIVLVPLFLAGNVAVIVGAIRLDWIEAEFARLTAGVAKTIRERRCIRCVGVGELSVSRKGIDCSAICPRCHGSKVDQSMEYR